MDEKYIPNELGDITKDDLIDEDLKAEEWRTGQCYEDTPAKQVKCKICGNDRFYIAQGNYWTGIKCPNCNYEICIHEG